ncbi:hypothetical protein ALC57_04258 [Trachymyrmex cornetzi]|uniref:Uncharacterized protein n=1 Tax=Trachymyrmex cornetzi TaxID=471704 RepID=A0A195EEU7_9HYME|nr:hypothetical protein ALC57_04258 [Trachymyrmex cornetzi]
MRPTGLSSAVMSKKTRGSAMFSAAAAKLRRSVSKDGRLGRAVAPKWLDCLKVESIDSRQIDLNAILSFLETRRKSIRRDAIRAVRSTTTDFARARADDNRATGTIERESRPCGRVDPDGGGCDRARLNCHTDLE